MNVEEFIEIWVKSSASERSNYQGFLIQLAQLIKAPEPEPASGNQLNDTYVFERPVKFRHASGTTGFIDLYKKSCFVLEAKQGSEKKRDRRTRVNMN